MASDNVRELRFGNFTFDLRENTANDRLTLRIYKDNGKKTAKSNDQKVKPMTSQT